jgi:proline iminopeptidase
MAKVAANRITLDCEVFGKPADPALVLVMGLGLPGVFWPDAFVQGLVAGGFRVVRFDNRDCGWSQRIEGGPHTPIPVATARSLMGLPVPAPYDLSDMAADVTGLMDALGIGRAHAVGASLGGMVAQVLAARWPDRVASLVSIMSSSGNPWVSAARPRALAAILHRPANPADHDALVRHFMHLFEVIGSHRLPQRPEEMRALCERAAARGYDVHGTARQLLAVLASGDRRAELGRVRAPTLVIHGTDDPLVPRSAGRDVARHITGAKLLEFDGMGHDLPPSLMPEIIGAIVAHCRQAAVSDTGV